MTTWNIVAASKPAYRVPAPASVVYWFDLALVAERLRRPDLRDQCLARAGQLAEEKRHGTQSNP